MAREAAANERKILISVRFPPSVRDAIVAAANQDKRPTSQWIEAIVTRHLEETGRLPKPKK